LKLARFPAIRRGFTFYVADPLSSIHESTRIDSMRDRSFLNFVTISVIGVALLISVGQIDAQTQAAMNAEARADFVKADA
jgi:hypothetical protein